MSLQGTIVPGRLRSELCPCGVKASSKQFEIFDSNFSNFLGIKSEVNHLASAEI